MAVTVSPAVPPLAIDAVLLDIEGTATPLTFVSDVLFPYARKHLRQHLARHAALPEYVALFDRLRDEHAADCRAAASRPWSDGATPANGRGGASLPPWDDTTPVARLGSVVAYCEWLMDRDRKSTGLKTLQGLIWQDGYARGELVGEVFADVPPALARWRAHGLQVGIFSSGSVLAQQLLFRHSSAGDLSTFLQWHFDTTTGAKTDAASYGRIADAMHLSPGTIVFVSDVVRELDAAREAGMHTRLSIRPGNAPQPAHAHAEIRTFDALLP